jgi:hypothetical protein
MIGKSSLSGAALALLTLFTVVDNCYSDLQGPKIIFPNLTITTSERSHEQSSYPLYQIIDDNPKTTWVFTTDAYDEGRNRSIQLEIQFHDDTNIKTIRMINGYSKSEDLYTKNNRITEVVITDDRNNRYEYDLEQTLSFQDITMPEPVGYIKLTAKKIVRGSRYDDTCISEIVLLDLSGEDILAGKEHFVFSSGGEYPRYILFDRTLRRIYAPESDGIVDAGFSPRGDMVYFINSEIDGIGFDIFDLKTKLVRNYLEGFVLNLEWITNTRVRVRYYDFDDNEKERVIDLSP